MNHLPFIFLFAWFRSLFFLDRLRSFIRECSSVVMVVDCDIGRPDPFTLACDKFYLVSIIVGAQDVPAIERPINGVRANNNYWNY